MNRRKEHQDLLDLLFKLRAICIQSGLDKFDQASALDMTIADIIGKNSEDYKVFASADLLRLGFSPERIAEILMPGGKVAPPHN